MPLIMICIKIQVSPNFPDISMHLRHFEDWALGSFNLVTFVVSPVDSVVSWIECLGDRAGLESIDVELVVISHLLGDVIYPVDGPVIYLALWLELGHLESFIDVLFWDNIRGFLWCAYVVYLVDSVVIEV